MLLALKMNKKKPSPHEIEVSTFGSGIGEAITFHYNNTWILIDSCINNTCQQPASLQYLKNINVDYHKDVKLVILTHWHDDHIRGMGRLIEECKNSKIVIPSIFKNKDFLSLFSVFAKTKMVCHNGVDECKHLIKYIISNGREFQTANCDTLLYCELFDETDKISVYALSPSAIAEIKSAASISSIFQDKIKMSKARIATPNHNLCSVASLINIKNFSLLFGADLEYCNNDQIGWNHVLKSSNVIKNKKSLFYKISHHGSLTGDSPNIWNDLLTPNPISTLTPFCKGRKKLPSSEDLVRITKRTTKAYLTSNNIYSKLKLKNKTAHKIAHKFMNNVSVVGKKCGHIRFRLNTLKQNPIPQIDLFDGAMHINSNKN